MREMKDSGIEWIGEIPKDWKIIKNRYLFNYNKELVGENFLDHQLLSLTKLGVKTKSFDAIGGKLPESFTTYQKVKTDDLIMCLFDLDVSAVFSGKSAYNGIISPAYKIFRNTKFSDINYYDYFFKFVFDERKYKRYSKNIRYTLTEDNFNEIPSICPSLDTQQRIADYLDKQCAEIDAVVEKTKSTIEEYKKLKQSIITEAVTKGLNPDASMKDSGIEWIGNIPLYWGTAKLKYLIYLRARLGWKGLKAEEYVGEGYPLLSAFNIINDKLIFSNLNFINQERYDESPEIKLQKNDILLVKDGAGIGKCAIVENLEMESTTNGSLAVITPFDNLNSKYLYYYFLSTVFQQFIDRIKGGMGVPHLFQGDLKEVTIPYPKLEEQNLIVSYLDEKCSAIDTIIEKKQTIIAELESYKKSLIYECVTGKKEV